jgi:hypothetical protein
MKSVLVLLALAGTCIFFVWTFGKSQNQAGYILERVNEVAKEQAGPHNGGGLTIGYNYFDKVDNFIMAFRKRVLKPVQPLVTIYKRAMRYIMRSADMALCK